METRFELKLIAEEIASKAGTKATLDPKFELEYIIPKVTETILTDLGFEFKEKSSYKVCPVYQKGNILALFDETILHVSKIC